MWTSMLTRLSNNFNPRTPRGVRRREAWKQGAAKAISIHAPREGCDAQLPSPLHLKGLISIHAPREGCD